jgi:predicted nucleotidyltransferase
VALTRSETAALDQFCAWVRARFAGRVTQLALFGSRARGEGTRESDLDVVVVVLGLTGAEAREIGHAAGDAMTNHDVLLSPFAVSQERMTELRDRERLIASEIARDAVPL